MFFATDFKLKDFLKDDETLSHFLHHNASLPRHALRQIVEADVNLEKVDGATCVMVLFSVAPFHMSDNRSPPATPHIYKSNDLGSIVCLRPRDSGTAKPLILMGRGAIQAAPPSPPYRYLSLNLL